MDDQTLVRRHHFFAILGECAEAARLGGFRVRLTLEDGSDVTGVPAESPLATGRRETQIDHTGVREDMVIGETVVMLARVRSFALERP